MGTERGRLGIDFHHHRPGPERDEWQFGGGVDQGRGADAEKDLSCSSGLFRRPQRARRQHFPEPDHVRAQKRTTVGAARRDFLAVRPVFHRPVLIEALGAEQVAMQFQHLMAAGPPVQAIHVLGDQGELGDPSFHRYQGDMAGVRFGLPHPFLPPGVPFPDQLRVAAEGIRRCQFFRVVARPQPGLGFAEGRHAALGGDAGAS